MIKFFPGSQRGRTQLDWLDSHHTFSFSDYFDAERTGFRSLRVINEDVVKPARGFGTHPHRDMEILTLVLTGKLKHEDNLGTAQEIFAGDLQRMTAGTGILHSEWNGSNQDPVHFLQIWIVPDKKGLQPSYQDLRCQDRARGKKVSLVASGTQHDSALKIHQDADIYWLEASNADSIQYEFRAGRYVWIQIVEGEWDFQGSAQVPGDGVALSDEKTILLSAKSKKATALLFDLA